MLKLRKNKKGFTLVELIVVIAIMAVLAGTVAGVTVSQLNKQKNNNAKSEVDTLMKDFQNFLLTYEGKITDAASGETALEAFAAEARATDGKEVFTDDEDEAKAGNHKFIYSVAENTVEGSTDKEVVFTFKATKVGNTGKDPVVTWTYSNLDL